MNTIRDIMTTRVLTVALDTTIRTITDMFQKHSVHHLLVCDRGKPQGLISDRDVLRATSPYLGTWGQTPRDEATLRRKAHQIMTRGLITITEETPIEEAISLILRHSISCLPVLDEEGLCVGILTWRDLVRWTRQRLDADAGDSPARAA